jgi:ATP-binding cassette subfamily B protein
MNSPSASSPAADSVASPAVKSAIHGTDTLVPSLDGDYQRGVNALWRVLRMALRYRVRFPAAVLAVIAAGVFQLLIPRYLGNAIDQALGLLSGAQAAGGATATQAQAALVTSALLVLGIAVMRGVFTLAHNYLA